MNKAKKIIIILFLICILFPKNVNALSQTDAGKILSEFAINFEADYAEETRYTEGQIGENRHSDRAMAYKGLKTKYKDNNYYYCMDCVGWVCCAIHWSLKLGNNDEFTDLANFRTANVCEKIHINEVSTLYPGDILDSDSHVGIYAIDPETNEEVVIHCTGWGRNGAGVERTNYQEFIKRYKTIYVHRITKEAAEGLDADNVTVIFNQITGASGGSLDDYGKYYGTTEGRYTGSYNIGDWLFDKIIGFFDYLVGMLTYIIRIPVLGWANIIEHEVNNFIQDISGANLPAVVDEEKTDETDTTEQTQDSEQETMGPLTYEQMQAKKEEEEKLYKPTATEKWERINIEDIIYNHVPILDVNFFSFDKAAGAEVKEGSIIYTIRSNIAKWYMIIRRVSIIILLFILIYLGIQTAIQTAAGKRGKYKSMLVAWVTSFIVIFCIHYFMMLVIDVNQFFVETFEKVNKNAVEEYGYSEESAVSIYDTIRTRAYSIKLSEGVPATIMYVVLVYYLIKFLYIYFKRYLTINILAIMGPIIAIKYAFDKIKSGKGGTLANWMFDFFINVFLQSIHAILYTVFMIMAYDLAMESIAGFVIALVVLHFLLEAEKIFINIFKFESKGSSLRDVREDKNYILEAYKTTMLVGTFAKGTAGFLFSSGKAAINLPINLLQDGINLVRGTTNYIGNKKLEKQGKETVDFEPIVIKDKVGDAVKKVGYKVGDGINNKVFKGKNLRLGLHNMKDRDPQLYETTDAALKATKNMAKKTWTRTIKKGTKTIGSIAKVMIGVPMAIVDTKEGSTLLYSGISDLKDVMKQPTHYGHKSKAKKNKKKSMAYKAAIFVTGGVTVAVTGKIVASGAKKLAKADPMINEAKQINKDAKKMKQHREKLHYLADINRLEDDIEKEAKLIAIQKEIEKNGKTEEEKEKIDKKYEEEIKNDVDDALNLVISAGTISSVVKDYMYENNITKMTDKDIENILKELGNKLDVDKLKVKFGPKIKENVKKEIKKELEKNKKR